MNETVDRRILGAFVCQDAITGSAVTKGLRVTAPQWNVKANRSGIYVIFDGPGFDLLTTQFLPSGTLPAPVPFAVTLQDPSRRYLPRRATINAPRSVPVIPAAPTGAATNPAAVAALQGNTVFNPQAVALYPAPSAPVGALWAVIHASVTRAGSPPGRGLPWAVLRVTRDSDKAVLATGQADANGEALLAVIGLRVEANTTGAGPVTLSTVAATVTAYFDSTVLDQPPGWIPDPDEILSAPSSPTIVSSSQQLPLGSGTELSLNFAIAV